MATIYYSKCTTCGFKEEITRGAASLWSGRLFACDKCKGGQACVITEKAPKPLKFEGCYVAPPSHHTSSFSSTYEHITSEADPNIAKESQEHSETNRKHLLHKITSSTSPSPISSILPSPWHLLPPRLDMHNGEFYEKREKTHVPMGEIRERQRKPKIIYEQQEPPKKWESPLIERFTPSASFPHRLSLLLSRCDTVYTDTDSTMIDISTLCGYCSTENVTKRCSRCKMVYYCNVICQRTHWPTHKYFCTHIQPKRKKEQITSYR